MIQRLSSGFEEIEIRMNDLSEKIEAEKKERETEIANIHHALSAHNYEIEALRNKVIDVETLNNTMMNGIGKYILLRHSLAWTCIHLHFVLRDKVMQGNTEGNR